MVPFDISMDARMLLARMSVLYERERGARIRMSRDEDIVTMLNFALQTLNTEYQAYYQSFVALLTPVEIRQLVAQGAQIYRGAKVGPLDEGPAPEPSGARAYRGVVQSIPEPSAPVASAASPASDKPKRIYRGRVVED